MFKSTDGGITYGKALRVNQDDPKSAADQFQPWMAITPKGQIDISYFDRRNDPSNYYIDTYLSRSNDGGKTFSDTRATQSVWDPEINPPISPSGQFIGDYQGIVADDNVAIPFWNDTQYANLPTSDSNYSPFQEVSAARIPNGAQFGGPGCAVSAGFRSAGVRAAKRGLVINFARPRKQAPGTYKVRLPSRGLPSGDYQVNITYRSGRKTARARLSARKL